MFLVRSERQTKRVMHGFVDRYDAGLRLADAILERHAPSHFSAVAAVGGPGAPVAGVVGAKLGLPVCLVQAEPFVLPDVPERVLGAVADGEVVVADARAVARTGLRERELAELADHALGRLAHRQGPLGPCGFDRIPGNHALAVCDGLQDPMCLVAAARTLRQQGARTVVLALPVLEHAALPAYAAAFDEVISIFVSAEPPHPDAWYADDRAVSDEEVATLIRGIPPPA